MMTGDEFRSVDFSRRTVPRRALCRTIVSGPTTRHSIWPAYTVQLGFETDKHRFRRRAYLSGEPSVTRAGDLLRYLATARGRADYDLAKPNVSKQVQNGEYLKGIIESADHVKELLVKANSDQAKAQAKAGISAHWK
jgi:hypothetical protein